MRPVTEPSRQYHMRGIQLVLIRHCMVSGFSRTRAACRRALRYGAPRRSVAKGGKAAPAYCVRIEGSVRSGRLQPDRSGKASTEHMRLRLPGFAERAW
jgi:hypothetical protein